MGLSVFQDVSMRQVLFYLPLNSLSDSLPDIPIYGYGTMLFLAFIACTWLAGRLAQRDGISKDMIQDLAVWLFISGIIGARITFMVQYWHEFSSPLQFFAIWDGGLVFYGSIFGGLIGFLSAYFIFLRRRGIPAWKMIDIVACCLALGLVLGRIGCLLNGCCYGNVACPDCPAVAFPLSSPPRYEMVRRGYQTVAGFTMQMDSPTDQAEKADRRTVAVVDPKSMAAGAGLQVGDIVVRVNEASITPIDDVHLYLDLKAKEAEGRMVQLVVKRDKEVQLPAFPWSGSGFTLIDCTVGQVEPHSPASTRGLKPGDVLVQVNEHPLVNYSDLVTILSRDWPRGLNDLQLTVVRSGSGERMSLPVFTPRTIGLHPTQIYESISMSLLLMLLLAFYPFRGRPGTVMVLYMVGYGVHRFLNEMLRTDTKPVAFNMTLSQNISLLVLAGAVLLGVIIWWKRTPGALGPVPEGSPSERTVSVA
jgi:prolipoprotein diacylglyceryltransferase